RVRARAWGGPGGFLLRGPPPLGPPPPGADQVRLLQNPVHRRGAQAGDVLVHHPPGQLPVPQLRLPAGVGDHRLPLRRQCLIRLHRLCPHGPPRPRPPPPPPPPRVRPPRGP